MKVWKEIIAMQNAKGNPGVAIGMKNVSLQPGFIVHIKLENSVLEDSIIAERSEIIETLRERLKNQKIRLKTEVDLKFTPKAKFITNKEKFEKLAKKNPALDKLRKKFKLDIDL